MTTFQTIYIIILVISTIVFLFSIWLRLNRYDEAALFGVISFLGLVLSGILLGGSLALQHEHESFEERRKLILSIFSTKLNAVCDRSGIDNTSTARPNCVDKQGFRAWREGDKLYLATVIDDKNVIEMIVEEDELLSGRRSSIIYWSDQLDERRLSYTFSPYAYSAHE